LHAGWLITGSNSTANDNVCLIVVAFKAHPEFPLIVAANRDEFHARPAQAADWWADEPDIVGGRDLLAGGTWLAAHRDGRFAAVTNYRDAEPKRGKLTSRGVLVTRYLLGRQSPMAYLASLAGDDFDGFNLLVADGSQLAYTSNQGDSPTELPPGIYGLSNGRLDSKCDKVGRSKARLGKLIATDKANDTELLRLLGDRSKGPADQVDAARLPFATAHAITAPFIVLPDFGTRCSTIVRSDNSGRWHFLERRFDASGASTGESKISFVSGKN